MDARTESVGEPVAQRPEHRIAELYLRHAAHSVQLAFLLTGNRETAEDLVQDAFVRLFGRFHDIRNPASFDVYLRRTIVNLSRDRFRRAGSERDYLAQHASGYSASTAPSSQIEDREIIRRALEALPHRQRAALVLRFFADLSEQQTAEVLQCSVSAVKSLVTRATGTMRTYMGSEGAK